MRRGAFIAVGLLVFIAGAYGVFRAEIFEEDGVAIERKNSLSRSDRAKLHPGLQMLVMGDFATVATASRDTMETDPSLGRGTIRDTTLYYSHNSRDELKEEYESYFKEAEWLAVASENPDPYALTAIRGSQQVFVHISENENITEVRLVLVTTLSQ